MGLLLAGPALLPSSGAAAGITDRATVSWRAADGAGFASAPRPVGAMPLRYPVPTAPGITEAAAAACAVSVTTEPLAAASVELVIRSVCDAGRRFEVRHEGIALASVLDEWGRGIVEMPALAADARYDVAVEGRPEVTAEGTPVDLDAFARAVLVMDAAAGLELHAYERGATLGEPGHVGPDAPARRTRALAGQGGYLTRLASPGADGGEVAVIYTAPRGTPVDIEVDAEVTEANCGRDLRATAIRTGADGALRRTPIVLAMPECDAVGELVMLGALLD